MKKSESIESAEEETRGKSMGQLIATLADRPCSLHRTKRTKRTLHRTNANRTLCTKSSLLQNLSLSLQKNSRTRSPKSHTRPTRIFSSTITNNATTAINIKGELSRNGTTRPLDLLLLQICCRATILSPRLHPPAELTATLGRGMEAERLLFYWYWIRVLGRSSSCAAPETWDESSR